MRGPIISICSLKGGVGKSRIAYELAATLDGVLVDLDPQRAGITYSWWGYDWERYVRRPGVDALESGDTPKPRRRSGRPDLVPSHPDLIDLRIDERELADALLRWSIEWERPLIIDTPPGRSVLTDGAVMAADLVVVPAPPGQGEIIGARDTLANLDGHRIVVVPNRMPFHVDPSWYRALQDFQQQDGVSIATPIRNHGLFQRRRDGRPVTRQPRPSKQVASAAEDFETMAREIIEQCRQTQTTEHAR